MLANELSATGKFILMEFKLLIMQNSKNSINGTTSLFNMIENIITAYSIEPIIEVWKICTECIKNDITQDQEELWNHISRRIREFIGFILQNSTSQQTIIIESVIKNDIPLLEITDMLMFTHMSYDSKIYVYFLI